MKTQFTQNVRYFSALKKLPADQDSDKSFQIHLFIQNLKDAMVIMQSFATVNELAIQFQQKGNLVSHISYQFLQ